MSTPTPFEIGRQISNNFAPAIEQQKDAFSIEDIFGKLGPDATEDQYNGSMTEILKRVSPKNQAMAAQILQQKKSEFQDKQREATYERMGLDKGIAKLPPNVQAQIVKNNASQDGNKIDKKSQDWAYKQLDKKPALQALNNSLSELKRLNAHDVTGPIAGNVPSSLANKEEDAIRKAIDANAIQILNVHKSMFPRGLTQGEFKTLSQKLVSSTNTKEANDQIINAYEKLAKMQTAKLNMVEEAVNKYGFDPMLPFIVSGIEKEFESKEIEENRALYRLITGEEPEETETIKETISTPNKRVSLEEIFKNG